MKIQSHLLYMAAIFKLLNILCAEKYNVRECSIVNDMSDKENYTTSTCSYIHGFHGWIETCRRRTWCNDMGSRTVTYFNQSIWKAYKPTMGRFTINAQSDSVKCDRRLSLSLPLWWQWTLLSKDKLLPILAMHVWEHKVSSFGVSTFTLLVS